MERGGFVRTVDTPYIRPWLHPMLLFVFCWLATAIIRLIINIIITTHSSIYTDRLKMAHRPTEYSDKCFRRSAPGTRPDKFNVCQTYT